MLVPGGWHGGWIYETLAASLRERGHDVWPITLTGLNGCKTQMPINLTTHVHDVVTLLCQRSLTDVILCGHSYGGMVITGVADLVPERISVLVYIDAFVPENGDSCWELSTDEFRALFIGGAGADGTWVAPPVGADSRARPHPLACLVQRLTLSGKGGAVAQRVFVYHPDWRGTPFTLLYERLRCDSAWTVHVVPGGHNAFAQDSGALLSILLAVSAETIPSTGVTEGTPSPGQRTGQLGTSHPSPERSRSSGMAPQRGASGDFHA